ncbi:uncharacterized protein LOC132535466 [Erinaceus europaeus]|uniref:Uncharacterized protein LOC132535466 n=1 Tax=Erinaceus europaeus TaxID=9365 RepID=A0ABM3WLB9_ERIEU|nr:uncharacterized protein LOC132535466 [Erinaceus europaeus]
MSIIFRGDQPALPRWKKKKKQEYRSGTCSARDQVGTSRLSVCSSVGGRGSRSPEWGSLGGLREARAAGPLGVWKGGLGTAGTLGLQQAAEGRVGPGASGTCAHAFNPDLGDRPGPGPAHAAPWYDVTAGAGSELGVLLPVNERVSVPRAGEAASRPGSKSRQFWRALQSSMAPAARCPWSLSRCWENTLLALEIAPSGGVPTSECQRCQARTARGAWSRPRCLGCQAVSL